MKDEMKKSEFINELEKLTNETEDFQNKMDLYCEFMKKVFLNGSCLN